MCMLSSGPGGTGLLDGLHPSPAGGMVTAAPLVTSNVHVANNVNGKQLPHHFTVSTPDYDFSASEVIRHTCAIQIRLLLSVQCTA